MDGANRDGWHDFSDANVAYLAELYERFRADPNSVDQQTGEFFARAGAPPAALAVAVGTPVAAPAALSRRAAGAIKLSSAIRMYGYRAARLDPLGSEPPGDEALEPATYGLREEDLAGLPASIVGGPAAEGAGSALEAIRRLRNIYEGSSGFEFEHVSNATERDWLREAVESGRYRPPKDPIDARALLDRLAQVEAFERTLHSAFPAQTRFSLEGLDVLVPMLDELAATAAEEGARELVLGMAHRGRLNVAAHLLGEPYEEIIAQFRGALPRPNLSACEISDVGWTGDVKYHIGTRKAYPGRRDVGMVITLAPNPSQLEFIDPVAEGMARAGIERRDRPGAARLEESAILAALIHGDASFPAEGVAAETLNLSRLPGYRVGGTVHIIANNQLGFTTMPEMGRSTMFASDLAKGFEIPIVHVNADEPEDCIAAMRLAHAYLRRFREDVLIDLIGYRRWGHNEGDEPAFTQPRMYAEIVRHPRVRELWGRELARRGVLPAETVEGALREAMARLQSARQAATKREQPEAGDGAAGLEAGGTGGGLGQPGSASEIRTAVAPERLVELNRQLMSLPQGFHLHPKLEAWYGRRRAALEPHASDGDGPRIDVAHAEALAFASILADGTPIRLTGQDTARGTFSQRHLVLHDVETGGTYTPLQAIPAARVAFDVWDSPLSEQAVLGFEFGYNVEAPGVLVLWEAQYGDFIDVAQAVVDGFIASARAKWAECPSLVLLLPHGSEGQGPDHSSARLERFLQMAGEDNMRIANCTTAAQYFHILRRQAQLLSSDPRPLVLATGKSLLRHTLAASASEELAEGRFMPVIDDAKAKAAPEDVRRLILCSGKIYLDLMSAERPPDSVPVAVVRVEELYPFPANEIRQIVGAYPGLREVAWVQEEPRNMGAWTFVAPRLRDLLGGRLPLLYVGRTRRASPAEGSHEWFFREQKRVAEAAFAPAGDGRRGEV